MGRKITLKTMKIKVALSEIFTITTQTQTRRTETLEVGGSGQFIARREAMMCMYTEALRHAHTQTTRMVYNLHTPDR